MTTLAAQIPRYLDSLAYEPVTKKNIRVRLNSAARFFGQRPLDKIGCNDIDRYLVSLEHLAISTRWNHALTLRKFFEWALRERIVRRNPALQPKLSRRPRRIPRALDGAKIAAWIAAAPDARGRALIILGVQEGLRCRELAQLEWGDVDWSQNLLRVVGKGGHERVLPLLPQAGDALRALHPRNSGPVFKNQQTGQAMTAQWISRLLSVWASDAGIKTCAFDGVSAHAARHTCATDMLRHGAHIKDVQAALGHQSVVTTEVYLPLIVNSLASAMEGRTY